jgi:hypothetical protein
VETDYLEYFVRKINTQKRVCINKYLCYFEISEDGISCGYILGDKTLNSAEVA